MFRAQPVANKLTDRRYHERCHELHVKRMQTTKSVLDTRPPKAHPHVRQNLKKEQIMEEWYQRVERENRILLEKMSFIMTHTTVGNVNDFERYSRSLNKAVRQRDLVRITQENQKILRRIQEGKAVYSHEKWDADWERTAEHIDRISEYGLLGQRSSASRPSLRPQQLPKLPARKGDADGSPRPAVSPIVPRLPPLGEERTEEVSGGGAEAATSSGRKKSTDAQRSVRLGEGGGHALPVAVKSARSAASVGGMPAAVSGPDDQNQPSSDAGPADRSTSDAAVQGKASARSIDADAREAAAAPSDHMAASQEAHSDSTSTATEQEQKDSHAAEVAHPSNHENASASEEKGDHTTTTETSAEAKT